MASPQAAPWGQVLGGRAQLCRTPRQLAASRPGPLATVGSFPLKESAASHLPGGRSADPPPSRSRHLSSARRPVGCGARGTVAIAAIAAAASAHPGSRGEPGARRRRQGAAPLGRRPLVFHLVPGARTLPPRARGALELQRKASAGTEGAHGRAAGGTAPPPREAFAAEEGAVRRAAGVRGLHGGRPGPPRPPPSSLRKGCQAGLLSAAPQETLEM